MNSPTSSTQSSLLDTPPPSVSESSTPSEPEHDHPQFASTSRPKVYPSADSGSNKPKQAFSRSARKRQSVQALGSIQFLQHHFTKVGIASSEAAEAQLRSSSFSSTSKLSPLAISPAPSHFLSVLPHLTLQDLPPSPARPNGQNNIPPFPPQSSEIRTDPELLRPGVVRDLKAVERVFELTGEEGGEVDVLELLKTTIGAIRSVRNFVVALPDDAFPTSLPPTPNSTSSLSPPSSASLLLPPPPLRPQGSSANLRPHQTFSTPSRPSHLSRPAQPRLPSSSGTPSQTSSSTVKDPVSQIRKSALDVLGSLRLVEERFTSRNRATSSNASPPISPSKSPAPSHLSPFGEESSLPKLPLSPSNASTSPAPSSSASSSFNLGWGSSSNFLNPDDDPEQKKSWEDRLGYLYEGGVTFETSELLLRERKVVESYLDLVDELLFGGVKGEVSGDVKRERGWDRERFDARRKRRGGRSSLAPVLAMGGSGDGVTVEDQSGNQEYDSWLDEGKDTATRLHSLLIYLLPSHFAHHLPSPSSTLEPFTNGQLLCQAFNFGVRRSARPWGFVLEHEIHDVLGEKETPADQSRRRSGEGLEGGGVGGRKEYIFRKVENLRVFAAALKLRYVVPVVPLPTSTSAPLPPQAIIFDPSTVAKREEGWEKMLDPLVRCWIDRIKEEEKEREEEEGRED
ncbi:hypothetical protein BDY24DRAFT_373661 [Mrakia frigida]|uniref:uncharacterized protein n=1 Tax=Mrakia frigida TaxID=29902 RepID=UPI003FCBF9F8